MQPIDAAHGTVCQCPAEPAAAGLTSVVLNRYCPGVRPVARAWDLPKEAGHKGKACSLKMGKAFIGGVRLRVIRVAVGVKHHEVGACREHLSLKVGAVQGTVTSRT